MNNSLLLTGTVCLLLAACNDVNTKTFDNLVKIVNIGNDKLKVCADNLPPLENGKQIKVLQQSLNRIGINVGVPDGKFGAATEKGIKKFQERNKLTLTGVPTKCLLDKIDSIAVRHKDGGAGVQTASESAFKPSKCIQTDLPKGLVEITDKAYQKLNEELPIDTEPYLEGFCTPDNKESLIKLYTVLVIEGAIHSRLALSKFSDLEEINKEGGLEVGITEDISRRARESGNTKLDEDLKTLGEDTNEGLEALFGDYIPINIFLSMIKEQPKNVQKLKGIYKEKAWKVIPVILQHSVSATFYLSRSTLTAKALTEYFGVETSEGKSITDNISSILDGITKSIQLGDLILRHEDEIMEMLVASTHLIKTFTEDLQLPEQIDISESIRSSEKKKEKNGFSVDQFHADTLRENNPKQMENKKLSGNNESFVWIDNATYQNYFLRTN